MIKSDIAPYDNYALQLVMVKNRGWEGWGLQIELLYSYYIHDTYTVHIISILVLNFGGVEMATSLTVYASQLHPIRTEKGREALPFRGKSRTLYVVL